MGKYDAWIIVFAHPIVGKLTWRSAPPQSLILYHLEKTKVTAFLELQWRDIENETAYYKVRNFLPD